MSRFPKDCSQRRIGEEARSLVHYKLPKNHWEFHEYTGTDHGVDCVIELVENEEYHNHKFEGNFFTTNFIFDAFYYYDGIIRPIKEEFYK